MADQKGDHREQSSRDGLNRAGQASQRAKSEGVPLQLHIHVMARTGISGAQGTLDYQGCMELASQFRALLDRAALIAAQQIGVARETPYQRWYEEPYVVGRLVERLGEREVAAVLELEVGKRLLSEALKSGDISDDEYAGECEALSANLTERYGWSAEAIELTRRRIWWVAKHDYLNSQAREWARKWNEARAAEQSKGATHHNP